MYIWGNRVFPDVPETQITLGTNLRADDIREGTDVYFDCTVDAVPPAYKVQWKRDVRYLMIILLFSFCLFNIILK